MGAYFRRYHCLDPFAAFGAGGTTILVAHFATSLSSQEELNEVNDAEQDFGGSALVWSTDGRSTFSDPVQIISCSSDKPVHQARLSD